MRYFAVFDIRIHQEIFVVGFWDFRQSAVTITLYSWPVSHAKQRQ
jgi:hypothetical protein